MKNNTLSNRPVAGAVYGPRDIGRLAEVDSGLPLLEFEGLSPRALFRTRDGLTHPIGLATVNEDGYPVVYFGDRGLYDDWCHVVGQHRDYD